MTHGRLLLDPPHSGSWRDRSDSIKYGYLSRRGGRRFRTTVQRWILGLLNTIFGSWHTFSGYLQQQIGDNQWDKICILGWKGSGPSNKKQEQSRDDYLPARHHFVSASSKNSVQKWNLDIWWILFSRLDTGLHWCGEQGLDYSS